MRKIIADFKKFVMRGNVVDLAVAITVGVAFTAVINSFVNDILNGILGAIGGKPNFNDLVLNIGNGQIRYGSFLTNVINFLITAVVVFFFVVKPVEKLLAVRRSDEGIDVTDEAPEDIALLREIRDLLKEQESVGSKTSN